MFAKVEETMHGTPVAEILSLEHSGRKEEQEEVPDISLNKETTRGFIEPNSTVQVRDF